MSNFPLYDNLSKLSADLKELNLNEISVKINKCTDEQQEIIAGLILHHYLLEKNKLKKNGVPYLGKYINDNKTGAVFNMNNLPQILKNIICYYVASL